MWFYSTRVVSDFYGAVQGCEGGDDRKDLKHLYASTGGDFVLFNAWSWDVPSVAIQAKILILLLPPFRRVARLLVVGVGCVRFVAVS